MPQIDRAAIKERAARLREKATEALHAFLDSLVGQEKDAIIESGGRARLSNFAAVKLAAPGGDVGCVKRILLLERHGDMLLGELA